MYTAVFWLTAERTRSYAWNHSDSPSSMAKLAFDRRDREGEEFMAIVELEHTHCACVEVLGVVGESGEISSLPLVLQLASGTESEHLQRFSLSHLTLARPSFVAVSKLRFGSGEEDPSRTDSKLRPRYGCLELPPSCSAPAPAPTISSSAIWAVDKAFAIATSWRMPGLPCRSKSKLSGRLSVLTSKDWERSLEFPAGGDKSSLSSPQPGNWHRLMSREKACFVQARRGSHAISLLSVGRVRSNSWMRGKGMAIDWGVAATSLHGQKIRMSRAVALKVSLDLEHNWKLSNDISQARPLVLSSFPGDWWSRAQASSQRPGGRRHLWSRIVLWVVCRSKKAAVQTGIYGLCIAQILGGLGRSPLGLAAQAAVGWVVL